MGILCRIFGHWWQFGYVISGDTTIGDCKTCRTCGDMQERIYPRYRCA